MNDAKSSNYSHIVVGGGSAGCIVAARLAQSGARVLLLEAGDDAREHPYSMTSDGFKQAFSDDAMMYHRMSTPLPGSSGRPKYAGTGRGLGGSGSVNGMVYTRGDKRDFESWPVGWKWDDLVPAFSGVEKKLGLNTREPTPFVQRFIDAACAVGFERKDGMNDGNLSGVVGANAMNFEGGWRRSSYVAWLHHEPPASLDVQCNAEVTRIVFDGHQRATAVEFIQRGQQRRAALNGELILCAGALESPRLLLLSGVGPASDLKALGIPLVQDAPGVGQNLQDHPNISLMYKTQYPVDFLFPQVYAFDTAQRPADAPRDQPSDVCFVCHAVGPTLKTGMLRMLPVMLLPGRLHNITPLRKLLRGLVHLLFALPGISRAVSRLFGVVVILGKPRSRGSVRLCSADPQVPANIDLAFFRDPHDRVVAEAALAKARDIVSQAPLAGAKPLAPGGRSDTQPEKLWQWIDGMAMTTFHFSGTCRMGNDADSPVDPQLRVKGLVNVRVADASVMPEAPVSALNAPSMMIGYRAADFILATDAKAKVA